jgi:ribosomal-protein-alanine N-acetyltransferase
MGSATAEAVEQSALSQGSDSSELTDKVFVCLMEPRHIPQVCELEALCFASPWNARMFSDEIEKNPIARYFILLDKQDPSCVVAYAGYWKILDEGHITNVAVRPQWQGQGMGTYLMEQMMAFASAEGITAMTLEVRQSNQAAQALYTKLGFAVEGLRKQYYADNNEDALLMWYRQKQEEGREQP